MQEFKENPPHHEHFNVHALYSKGARFKAPALYQYFHKHVEPHIDLFLDIASTPLEEEGNYEVVLTIDIQATVGEKKEEFFSCNLTQAGIFNLSHMEKQHYHHALGTTCAKVLFNYARAMLSQLLRQAGISKLYLAPVNFDELYRKKMQEPTGKPTDPIV